MILNSTPATGKTCEQVPFLANQAAFEMPARAVTTAAWQRLICSAQPAEELTKIDRPQIVNFRRPAHLASRLNNRGHSRSREVCRICFMRGQTKARRGNQ